MGIYWKKFIKGFGYDISKPRKRWHMKKNYGDRMKFKGPDNVVNEDCWI
jgi:hypothetical protein